MVNKDEKYDPFSAYRCKDTDKVLLKPEMKDCLSLIKVIHMIKKFIKMVPKIKDASAEHYLMSMLNTHLNAKKSEMSRALWERPDLSNGLTCNQSYYSDWKT